MMRKKELTAETYDDDAAESTQVIYLNFTGAANAAYVNRPLGLEIDGIQVADSGFAAVEIQAMITILHTNTSGMRFVAERPATDPAYSTIYIGDTTAFDHLGPIKAIAEPTGSAAARPTGDHAFVLLHHIVSRSELLGVIAHEAGHWAEVPSYDSDRDDVTVDDFTVTDTTQALLPGAETPIGAADDEFPAINDSTIYHSAPQELSESTSSDNSVPDDGALSSNDTSADEADSRLTASAPLANHDWNMPQSDDALVSTAAAVTTALVTPNPVNTIVIGDATYTGDWFSSYSNATDSYTTVALQNVIPDHFDVASERTVIADQIVMTGNTTLYLGGAIYNNGTATVTGSTFNGNFTETGGAIFSNDMLELGDSTFSNNSANNQGGALATNGTVAINHSTFSGNSAQGGGTIYNFATLTIDQSTLEENSAIASQDGRGGAGDALTGDSGDWSKKNNGILA